VKRIITRALRATAILVTLGAALAQAETHTVQAKIPFAFIVRTQVLPAGTYRISADGTGLVQIRAIGQTAMELSTSYVRYNQVEEPGKLIFNKYGDQYFLREILCDSARISVGIPASKLEAVAKNLEVTPNIYESRLARLVK
jgi:hypothetical protein